MDIGKYYIIYYLSKWQPSISEVSMGKMVMMAETVLDTVNADKTLGRLKPLETVE